MTLIGRVLAPGIWGAELADQGQALPLPPAEAMYVRDAAEVRRRQFALGRHCARLALAQAGSADAVLLRGGNGAPLWPPGFAGSISHTVIGGQGYAAALAARSSEYPGLGVDAEVLGGVGEELVRRLFGEAERRWLAGLDGRLGETARTLLFSAKEAVFKALPAGSTLVFPAMTVTISGLENGQGTFTARTEEEGSMEGRFVCGGGLALTAAFRPA